MTAQQVAEAAVEEGLNVRVIDSKHVGLAFGETLTRGDVEGLLRAFGVEGVDVAAVAEKAVSPLPAELARKTEFMTHPVFHSHQSETQVGREGRREGGREGGGGGDFK
jgi:glycine dehydrogenase